MATEEDDLSEGISVSIIVPSLNAVEGIERSLSSLEDQTIKDIEILCVDAGSDDGTKEIIGRYIEKDSRFKLIISDRKSYGYQVNLGIEYALGKYIGIVEADDHIDPGMYEKLYEVASKHDTDFVRADYFEEYGSEPKNRYRELLRDDTLYEAVVNISSHPECLLPDVVATWSGIYKKDYLEINNIRHNETPGASYQDTGFWALTHLFAKRGYFVPQAFYHYRIDNPNSSTFSIEKPFCLCDEMHYVSDKIKEYRYRSEKQQIYSRLWWLFYRKYKRNIERVRKPLYPEYYQRFADDMKVWKETFSADHKYFYDEERAELSEIISQGDQYTETVKRRRDSFIDTIKPSDRIVIYGAGRIGESLLSDIKERAVVEGFGVTKMNCYDSVNAITADDRGYPIREIGSYDRSITVVIASKIAEYRAQMKTTAETLGFSDIRLIPFGVWEA